MNDVAGIVESTAAISRAFSTQLAYISSNPPKTDNLVYLLPPCLVLLAIDVATRLTQRTKPVPVEVENKEEEEVTVREAQLRHVIDQVHEVLIKFQALEKKLSTEQARSTHLSRMLQKQKNFALHRQRLLAHNANVVQQQAAREPETGPEEKRPTSPPTTNGNEPKNPFEAFCQRIVLQNKIWAQQREIRALQKNLDEMKTKTSSSAFQAFCDRLLLSNNIWRQKKEIDRLVVEADKLKRARDGAIAHAATHMMQDVRKERLAEEFVRDLIAEVQECKQAIVTLKSEHEREVEELAEDWRKECRQLRQEVDRLRLARDAHLLEQDLSNEMEGELLERLQLAEEDLDVLDEQSIQLREDSLIGDNDDTLYLSDSEHMSNISSSTCVDGSPNEKSFFDEVSTEKMLSRTRHSSLPSLKSPSRRHSTTYIAVSPTSAKSPGRRLDPGPYAGFSFNPLFFGPTASPRGDEPDAESSPMLKRVRTTSLRSIHASLDKRSSSRLSMRSTAYSTYSTGSTNSLNATMRPQWRI
ncbi:hypothetical protein D9619_008700 [Psilocybe cf. subviscida]|uniref:Uncharacterized protein n=1 Tax=Psilocybe cf. subviscida TaxID=2480587 RepID=A0A8H5BBN9_9AGAR|nr:hypothetical protein D9619_008700 [Psilocybe cf. subviscida]